MASPKGKRNYKSLWLLSLSILVIGIVLTIKLALIRPLGFTLLAVGGIGMVWAIINMDRGGDDEQRPTGFR